MAWKPLETRPHHVSGARGDSGTGASHRTVQTWMDSREKTARGGTPETKKEKGNHCGKERTYSWSEEHSQLQADRGQSAFSQTDRKQASVGSRSPDTDHPTRWQRRQAKQHRGADGSDNAQSLEAQQSQFIEETMEIPVSAQKQTGFRRYRGDSSITVQ